jgi:hypothetical protein
MLIVSLFPTLFAYWLFAYPIPHCRGSAPLYSVIGFQFSTYLLSVTHPAIPSQFHTQTDSIFCTVICLEMSTTFELHRNSCFLWWMCNASGDSIQAKKGFATIAWDKWALLHQVWSLCTRPIPMKTNTVVHDGQCKINLKIVMTTMVIQIPFPLFLPIITFDKKTHHKYAAWITLSNSQQKILK